MSELFLILIATVLVQNFVLVQFLGLCPVMGVSNRFDHALGLSLATALVLTLAAGLSHVVHRWILIPLDAEYLRTLSFILLIAVVVQTVELILRWGSPLLHQVLGLFLPLITSNCAVLGVALLNARQDLGLGGSLLFGFGAAMGFGLVLLLFAALRERAALAPVPEAWRGAPIGLVSAGLMALAFMGFSGMDRGA